MIPKLLARLLLAALACCLLSSCRSKFHLLLFNNTDDTITIYLRTSDPTPLVVLAGISGDITGVSTDDFIIEHNGKLLHYRFPLAYTFPTAAVPSGYQRNVRRIGRSFYFQLASDNRIYLLPEHDPLQERNHPPQPAGFPLSPH
jgi:hypothetical protein